MTWTVAKNSGAVSFSHWLGEPGQGGPVGRMGTAQGALPVAGGHALDGDGKAPAFEIFPGQSKFLYDDLFYYLPMMTQVVNGDGQIVAANKAVLDTLGCQEDDLIGRHCLDMLTPESAARLRNEVFGEFFDSGYVANAPVTFVTRTGERVEALMSVIGYKNGEGRIERSVAMFADMSEQARTEDALRRSEQRFRHSFEAAAHGMALLDADGRVSGLNGAMCAMLGLDWSKLSGSQFMDLVVEEDRPRAQALFSELIRNAEASHGEPESGRHGEFRLHGGDDAPVQVLASLSAVRDGDGAIDQFVVQVVDITSRQRAEQHLRQAQKMEAVGQLTGGIAHDFNNLLTVVIGNLQLVESAIKDNDKARKRAKEAIEAAVRGSDLTRQLLAFARRQSLAPKPVEINSLIKAMETLIERSVGETVDVRLDLMDGEPVAVADPEQLETAILNLANNARQAMARGGRLTVETQAVRLDEQYCAEHDEVSPGSYVMIAVSDTGEGIPKPLLHKVFQPFFTTREVGKGSGLGLAMVFGFIKQSGGHIKIYSEEGAGTSVKMYLPCVVGQERDAGPVEEGEASARRARILVVEDQEDVREVACGFLEEFGHEVLQAGDGVSALQILQDRDDIDLLFTDVVMPGGMNGFDLSQAASQIRPELKIIHASGYPKGAMVHQEEPRLKDNLISKPYQRDQLFAIVEETLAGTAQ